MCPLFYEPNDRCAPASLVRLGELEGNDLRDLSQDGVDRALKNSGPLSMNDPDPENAFFTTGLEVFRDEILDFGRPEGVKVESPLDGNLDRLRIIRIDQRDFPFPALRPLR